MPIYRVKPGKHHGPYNEYGPGDLVEHTEYEASGFLDKLELVVEETPAENPEASELAPTEPPVEQPEPEAPPEKPKSSRKRRD